MGLFFYVNFDINTEKIVDRIEINMPKKQPTNSTDELLESNIKPQESPVVTSKALSTIVAVTTIQKVAIAALVIGAVGVTIFSFGKYRSELAQLTSTKSELANAEQQLAVYTTDPSVQTANDNQATIDAVGKLIVLPTGEEPTIATVTDPKALQDQPFFANAEVGDRVLIYQTSKKAILYRPSTNIILNIAPLTVSPTPLSQGSTGTTPSSSTTTKK